MMRGREELNEEDIGVYGYRRNGDLTDGYYGDNRGNRVRIGGQSKKRYLTIGGVVCCVLLLLLIVFNSSSDNDTNKTLRPKTDDDEEIDWRGPYKPHQKPDKPSAYPLKDEYGFGDHYRFKSLYGYDGEIESIREQQFPQLNLDSDGRREVYLDYMGSGQYQFNQLQQFTDEMTTHLYGNAHSASECSEATTKRIDDTRDMILRFFGTDSNHYTVVFTASATAALKLVGETFRFGQGSKYVYLRNNHNSVIGIREYALSKGADFTALSEGDLNNMARQFEIDHKLSGPFSSTPKTGTSAEQLTMNLLAVPAQDNFDGSKYPFSKWLDFVDSVNRASDSKKWRVVLDAAAYVPTNPLDLSKVQPDYVVMSFYKLLGFPTGIGALLVRNDAFIDLEPIYWGGGQARVSLAEKHFRLVMLNDNELFESGTLPFLNIVALSKGIPILEHLGMERIQRHVFSLTTRLYSALASLKHSNGESVCEIYGNHLKQAALINSGDDDDDYAAFKRAIDVQGSIVTLNIKRSDGSYVGYSEVLHAAGLYHINVRSGCMCNPGSCYEEIGIDPDEIIAHKSDFDVRACYNDMRINGKPVGAIRVSIGYPTTAADVDAFVSFVRETYVD